MTSSVRVMVITLLCRVRQTAKLQFDEIILIFTMKVKRIVYLLVRAVCETNCAWGSIGEEAVVRVTVLLTFL